MLLIWRQDDDIHCYNYDNFVDEADAAESSNCDNADDDDDDDNASDDDNDFDNGASITVGIKTILLLPRK